MLRLGQHGLGRRAKLLAEWITRHATPIFGSHSLFSQDPFLGDSSGVRGRERAREAWSALQAQPGMSVRHKKIRGRGRQGLMFVHSFAPAWRVCN